jgi:hypothetical protein
MSDEARREKKQRIQENRERRAERAHEEKQIANQQVTIQPNNSLIDQPTDVTMVQINQPAPPIVQPPPMVQPISNIIPSSVLPPLPQPSIISPPMPPVVPVLESSTNAMQQAIQAQQVQKWVAI